MIVNSEELEFWELRFHLLERKLLIGNDIEFWSSRFHEKHDSGFQNLLSFGTPTCRRSLKIQAHGNSRCDKTRLDSAFSNMVCEANLATEDTALGSEAQARRGTGWPQIAQIAADAGAVVVFSGFSSISDHLREFVDIRSATAQSTNAVQCRPMPCIGARSVPGDRAGFTLAQDVA